ncbi:hypothetical protein [Brevibacillus agri]|uniref:hypothetical protein n=1 Tax=Brevibacillus agri TaxID=51101 RepID=UPI003D1DE21E
MEKAIVFYKTRGKDQDEINQRQQTINEFISKKGWQLSKVVHDLEEFKGELLSGDYQYSVLYNTTDIRDFMERTQVYIINIRQGMKIYSAFLDMDITPAHLRKKFGVKLSTNNEDQRKN